MTQEERLDYLIKVLFKESGEINNLKVDKEDRRTIL